MTKWFGESWGAPVCEPSEHIETPEGGSCFSCWKVIKADDQGVIIPFATNSGARPEPWHLDCFLKNIGAPR